MISPSFFLTGILLPIAALCKITYHDGPDYENLPRKTIFPGPWEDNIRAPSNKSFIQPSAIFAREGRVSGAESLLLYAKEKHGSWNITTGGLVTFQFKENISGKCVASALSSSLFQHQC